MLSSSQPHPQALAQLLGHCCCCKEMAGLSYPSPACRDPSAEALMGVRALGRKGVITGLLCPVSRGQRWMCLDWGLVGCVPTRGRAGREQYGYGGPSTGLTTLGLWGV